MADSGFSWREEILTLTCSNFNLLYLLFILDVVFLALGVFSWFHVNDPATRVILKIDFLMLIGYLILFAVIVRKCKRADVPAR